MSFHLFHIAEVYSNADGSVQFIEFFGDANGQDLWAGRQIIATGGGAQRVFNIPANLPSSTTNDKSVLVATQGYADYAALNGLPAPDFFIPNGFLFTGAGGVSFPGMDSLSWTSLPTDGNSVNGSGVIGANSPANFFGATGSIPLPVNDPGTPGDDSLVGTPGNDTLSGGDGNDTLDGGGDNDTLDGGPGLDSISGGTGNDLIIISDEAHHAPGETSNGGGGDDVIRFTSTTPAQGLVLSAGVTQIERVEISDADGVTTGTMPLDVDASAVISGGLRITGNNGVNSITGTNFGDVIVGNDGNDSLLGGGGPDIFLVGLGTHHGAGETINGGADFNTIRFTSTTPNDTLELSLNVSNILEARISNAAGATTGTTPLNVDASGVSSGLNLIGNNGANVLTGTASHDVLIGGGGPDTLLGGGGNDNFEIGAGDFTADEVIDGGAGANSLVYTGTTAATLVLTANITNVENLLIEHSTAPVNLDATNVDRTGIFIFRIFGNDGANALTGTAEIDWIIGGGGADTLVGGAGDDLFLVFSGADFPATERINGGPGNDLLRFTGEAANIVLGAGVIALEGVEFTSTASANASVNAAAVTTGLFISGNEGGNTLTGTNQADTIAGHGGDDSLVGLGGNDSLNGGAGNDTLNGGAGADNLQGGAGDDIILLASPAEFAAGEVIDGGDGSDTLRFTSAVAGTLTLTNLVTHLEAVQIANAGGVTTGLAGINVNAAAVDNALSITGNNGVNILTGTGFDDTLLGNGGNDVFLIANAADHGAGEAINGGAGVDVIRFTSSTGGDTLSLSSQVTALEQVVIATAAGLTTDTTALNVDGSAVVANGLSITGNAGANTLTGTGLNDVLNGGGGNDILIGGLGNDTLIGGLGNESYFVDAAADVVSEGLAAGTDTVFSSASFTLGLNVENLELTGSDPLNGIGNALGNVLTGNDGANVLTGNAGHDTLIGGAGQDTVNGGTENDRIVMLVSAGDVDVADGGAGSDTLALAGVVGGDGVVVVNLSLADQVVSIAGDPLRDTLTQTGFEHLDASGLGSSVNATGSTGANLIIGSNGNDTLNGGLGNDTLNGGAGDDAMDGGAGNDTYVADSLGDTAIETIPGAAGGTDLVQSAVDFTLDDNVENLMLTGVDPITGTGNTLNNAITGNSGNNTLSGGGGNDTLVGGAGDDSLDGGAGTDNMSGGAGNDSYTVEVASDVVTEAPNAGTDKVFASLNYTLGANLENLELTGGALNGTGNTLNNILTGNSGNNLLSGLAGNDTLLGGDGLDTLLGGAGVDNLQGEAGNDVFLYAAPTDFSAGEALDGGADTDTLRFTSATAAATLVLSGTVLVESVVIGSAAGLTTGVTALNVNAAAVTNALTLIGNNGANVLTGTAQADTLTGNGGNDVLNGGLGDDTADGGLGNDTFNGGAGEDLLQGGDGNDVFLFGVGDSGLNESVVGGAGVDALRFTASSGTLDLSGVVEVEGVAIATAAGLTTGVTAVDLNAANVTNALSLFGNNGANQITGTAFDDVIMGNAGNDALIGLAGNDTLDGGLGTDAMTGGDGNDLFVLNMAVDSVIENPGEGSDTVRLAYNVVAPTLIDLNVAYGGNVENAQATGTGVFNLTGNSEANSLTGNASNNILIGNAGNDTLSGGAGRDTVQGGTGDDVVLLASTAEFAAGEAIDGGDDIDTLRYTGAAVATLMLTANVTNMEAVELVSATGPGTAAIHINAAAVGNGLSISGNAGNNMLTGTAFADTVNGNAGNDTLIGGAGDDTQSGGDGNDVVLIAAGAHHGVGEMIDGGAGSNVIRFTSTTANDTLTLSSGITGIGEVEASDAAGGNAGTVALNINAAAVGGGLLLTGNAGVNTLTGTAFNDTLDGGLGADSLTGGLGNDTYSFDHLNDSLTELAGEGVDTLRANRTVNLATEPMFAEVENVVLTGAAALNATGDDGGNALTGNTAANVLNGGEGNDTLLGGGGADNQQGGLGDDLFVLNAVAEFAAGERIDGGDGTDTLRYTGAAAATLTLTNLVTNIEQVQVADAAGLATGTAAVNVNAAALANGIALTGNDGANVLTGTNQADTINGLGGNDTLVGGAGDDSLNGGEGNDVVLIALAAHHGAGEMIDGGLGTNVIRFTGTAAGTLTLSSNITNVTEVEASDAAGANTGTVALNINAAAHGSSILLTGNAGANVLTGTAFGDTISGGMGADNQQGGLGDDLFLLNAVAEFGATEVINGGDGTDTLRYTGGAGTLTLTAGVSNIEQVQIATLAGDAGGIAAININAAAVTNALTITGNAGNNILTGTAFADTVNGNAGNDTLDGRGGADILAGGAGNDILIWDPADISVAGGEGTDALQVNGAGVHVDLTAVADNVITDVEVINLTGSGNNVLSLTLADALAISSTTDTLRVDGNAGDVINAGLGWTQIANVTIGGQTYAQYTQGGATLQVDTDINRVGINSVNLAALNGANGFKLSGTSSGDYSGQSVSGAGDVNGDGFDDLIVGAPQATNHLGVDSGVGYIVFGKAGGFGANINLSSLDGTTGFRFSGAAFYDFAGNSVSGAGDVNGDGFDDLIVGAPVAANFAGQYSGAGYVVFGKGSAFPADVNPIFNGTTGFMISGEQVLDLAGWSVSDAGDVNGDGFGDLIVGAPARPYGMFSGTSYVVFGKAGGFSSNINLSSLDGTAGFKISNTGFYDYAGYSVSSAGDVNGDGVDDLVIGAYLTDRGLEYDVGATYVVFGSAGGLANINLSDLDGTNGFKLSGVAHHDYSGFSVSTAGDVNGDGFGDIIVGAHSADPNGSKSGASYVLFGKAGGFSTNINLSDLNGTNGFKLSGVALNDYSGASVSSAGDVNGDGFGDLIVGAPFADPGGSASGAAYVMFGKADGFASTINLSSLNGTTGFRLSGVSPGDHFGIAVSGAGDVNGDGFGDLIVGARDADPNGSSSGASYLIFGGDFRNEVDFAGTEGNDNLVGTAADEILISGLGNDTLDGAGGVDVLKGGAGNDSLVFDAADRLVDGGSGVDTLDFTGSGQSLDFTAIVDTRYTGIEIVDLTGTGDNSLALTTLDLLNLSDSTNTLRVDGDAGDSVISTGQGWADGGTVDIGGTLYQSYTDGAAMLLLHPNIVADSLIL